MTERCQAALGIDQCTLPRWHDEHHSAPWGEFVSVRWQDGDPGAHPDRGD